MDLELVDGIGHPCALVSRMRCCHVIAPQSSSSGTLWPILPPVLAMISFCIRS